MIGGTVIGGTVMGGLTIIGGRMMGGLTMTGGRMGPLGVSGDGVGHEPQARVRGVDEMERIKMRRRAVILEESMAIMDSLSPLASSSNSSMELG